DGGGGGGGGDGGVARGDGGPTTLTVDLLEERLLAAEQSIVAVGASRGDPRTPIFEGRSVLRLPLAGAAALAGARGAGALVEVAGAVEAVVEAVEGVGVVVGVVVVVVVEVSAAAVEAVAAVAAAGVAEAVEVAEAAEAVVELVAELHRGVLGREVLSPQELREWFARRWSRAAGAGGPAEAAGVGPTGGSAGASGGPGAAGSAGPGAAGATGVGAAGGVGAGGSADAGTSAGAGAGAAGAGGATGAGAPAGSPGAVPAGSGGAPRPRPYFVPLLEQVLGLPPSPRPAPPFECPQPVQSQSLLQHVSPLPAPSPYTSPTGGLAERRAPASRPASPARPACTSRPRPPAVPGTHQMALRPSTAPLRVPLPSPPASSLPAFPDPESDSLRVASPTVARFLATVVTDPSLASTAPSALVAELVDFAASCRLDFAASLEEFQCFAAALPHLVSTLLAAEGDPDAPDIPTPRSYAEAIEGPYSSQWVKRPPGSPPVFKARYVARGFSQRQGVDYFQTFSPTPKMTTLRVLLHVAAQRDYELHSLDFSTAFLTLLVLLLCFA
ncbi:unnamed protein product, partial [Closterium sp. NIES-53]